MSTQILQSQSFIQTPNILSQSSSMTSTSQKEVDSVLSKVPVTIVTGFLGTGKTTLLKYVLNKNHGKRIAVIENEFGDEQGIERLIARDNAVDKIDLGELFIELKNGCICCSVRDDLVITIENLLQIRNKFDYIIIETTGVADPGPIVGAFWLDKELESRLYLDCIITVVDLLNLGSHLDDPRKGGTEQDSYVNEAHMQIAYADRVLLNKVDLVTADQFSNIQSRVVKINPFARTIATSFCECPLDEILDVKGYESIDDIRPNRLQLQLLEVEKKADKCAKQEGYISRHDPSVKAYVIRTSVSLELRKLQRWIGELLWEREKPSSMELFRIKGYVGIQNSDYVHIFQAVHQIFEIEPSQQKWGSGNFMHPQTRLVFIGRNVNKKVLLQGVESCC